MAESNSYPMLSVSNWWNIRKKFKQTIPGTVTASYLSSVLNMQERSATNNIMPYLRQIGIIDAEGKNRVNGLSCGEMILTIPGFVMK